MFKLFSILSLIRTNNLIIANLAIIVTFYLLNKELNVLYALCSLIVTCCMASGYIINDILDTQTDIINQKKNYIAKGLISTQQAYFLIVFFTFLYIFFSFQINFMAQIILYVFVLPIMLLYNFFLKKYALIGNICVAIMLGAVFIFTECVIAGSAQHMYIISFFAFGINFIREIIKDVYDSKGDELSSMYTLPILLGRRFSIGFIKFFIIVFGFLFAMHAYYYSVKYYFAIMIILVEIPLCYSLFLLSSSSSKKTIYNLTKLYKSINVSGLVVIIFMKETF